MRTPLIRSRTIAILLAWVVPLGGGAARGADSPQWLVYPGGDGPGNGKRVVLIAADQEYRSEQSMPMMAKILSRHHGFDCTVLFGVNDKGEVDPTLPVYPEKGKEFKEHHINAVYWGMGMESAITPGRSVGIVGTYQPLESGFNYDELGVVPKPVSAYK